jgi:hypothetical protein
MGLVGLGADRDAGVEVAQALLQGFDAVIHARMLAARDFGPLNGLAAGGPAD